MLALFRLAIVGLPSTSRAESVPIGWLVLIGMVLVCPSNGGAGLGAVDFSTARAAFFRGDYDECIEMCQAEVERGVWNDVWSRQLVEAQLQTGQYQAARETYEQVSDRFSRSIPLRILAAEAYRFSGQHEIGKRLLDEIPELVQAAPWRYSDRDNMIAIGRYLLSLGEDARAVLDAFYDRALKSDPKYVAAHLAIAELALDKSDYQEAVRSLETASELQPDDPQVRYLLAKAWAPSDAARASEQLSLALELNPRHSQSLLMRAENMIDSENYTAADEMLEQVLEVNPQHPIAWSLKAAVAHLQGNYQQEGELRKKALATWQLNPAVDFTIGQTLSQHYRFAEGVKYQRRALHFDPSYRPARFQLAQDLLRVGADDEGWSIVDQVAESDKYNVVAFNLKTLQKRLAQFTTLEAPGLLVRMDAREAKIYGPRVLELLTEARAVLSDKYEFELQQPVTVEIFPQQSDFAIRTFGLPGGAGFLGVCFGSLITANSPASQGDSPSNWESVLWHEFCHVITLQKTNNRMPRWLSEGISVYEELERDASWGQSMSPLYQQMLLGEDFVPLSQLSGAFLRPPSPLHLQFAYYESSLAVRYLIEQHGLPLLLRLLDDLGAGMPIEEAFSRRYGDSERMDEDFEQWVRAKADGFLPDTDFEREGLPQRASPADLEQWLRDHPGSYFAQRMLVEQAMAAKRWQAALSAARELKRLYPHDADPGGALEILAAIARELGDRKLELETLEELNSYSSDHLPGLLRLVALYREEQRWPELAKAARKLLAVQPLIATGHEALVEASLGLKDFGSALPALRALQEMQPLDPAGLHFQLAQALSEASRIEEARIEVLQALEFTPRFREAQLLLVDLHTRMHANAQPYQLSPPDPGQPPRPPSVSSVRSP